MRRRRSKKASPAPKTERPVTDPGPLGHNPFSSLKNMTIVKEETPPEPEPQPLPPVEDDEDLFRAAMAEVDRPNWRNKGRVRHRNLPRDFKSRFYSEDLEVLATLEDLVSGGAPFHLVDTDEYLEGNVRGMHPIILEKLRRGRFSIQAYLDLHGLTLREASESVREFVIESMGLGYRCILLIHGRGLNSKDQIPVLKKNLETMLLKGPVRKHILAFTSALPVDGGAGASYVLLRARK